MTRFEQELMATRLAQEFQLMAGAFDGFMKQYPDDPHFSCLKNRAIASCREARKLVKELRYPEKERA